MSMAAPKDLHLTSIVEESKIVSENNSRPVRASVMKELDVGTKFSLKEQMEKQKVHMFLLLTSFLLPSSSCLPIV